MKWVYKLTMCPFSACHCRLEKSSPSSVWVISSPRHKCLDIAKLDISHFHRERQTEMTAKKTQHCRSLAQFLFLKNHPVWRLAVERTFSTLCFAHKKSLHATNINKLPQPLFSPLLEYPLSASPTVALELPVCPGKSALMLLLRPRTVPGAAMALLLVRRIS